LFSSILQSFIPFLVKEGIYSRAYRQHWQAGKCHLTLTFSFLSGGLTGKKKKGKNKTSRHVLDHSYTIWAKFLPARFSPGLVRAIIGILFADDDISQSPDYRFGEAGSFGA
jgi:hypothetical protein